MPSLRDLQTAMIGAVLDGEHGPAARYVEARGIAPARRLGVYANNALGNFLQGLRASYPAVRRLVGDAYFDQCGRGFRQRHPSRSGDLQDAGDALSGYLAQLHADDDYRYLGDVARLEWLYQEAMTAADHAPLDLGELSRLAPSDHERLRFGLHPATRLFASPFPVLDIWEANADEHDEPETIDLRKGGDRLLLTRTRRRLFFLRISVGEEGFLHALGRRERFAAAVETALGADGSFDAADALRKFVGAEAIVDFDTN